MYPTCFAPRLSTVFAVPVLAGLGLARHVSEEPNVVLGVLTASEFKEPSDLQRQGVVRKGVVAHDEINSASLTTPVIGTQSEARAVEANGAAVASSAQQTANETGEAGLSLENVQRALLDARKKMCANLNELGSSMQIHFVEAKVWASSALQRDKIMDGISVVRQEVIASMYDTTAANLSLAAKAHCIGVSFLVTLLVLLVCKRTRQPRKLPPSSMISEPLCLALGEGQQAEKLEPARDGRFFNDGLAAGTALMPFL
eukprot:TRINITY_DN63726_c0_g1_i1.p1 TRINITY_DN63726_c0_g1~~TRINITY_DN63726_c0_g1_i1.p1  ORF type:complete len:257 (+),score=44.02 TRINITY_DN63726_c0_g1_i1:113-883(+)